MNTLPLNKNSLASIPNSTGVYLFKKNKEILYIGKAVSLKVRLLSHLENAKLDAKESIIIKNSDRVEYFLTDSEFKALLLESSLIQKFQPKYNSRWKDDKSYLYIKITVRDKFPKIYTVRRESDGKSLYFGPLPSEKDAEEILRMIRRLFPFCRQKKISKRPCFYSKIGLCEPCPNFIANIDAKYKQNELRKIYLKNINSVISVLEGKVDLVLAGSYKLLKKLIKEQRYEEALIMRNKIRHFEQIIQQKQFSSDILINFNRSAEALKKLQSTLRVYFPKLKQLNRIEGYDVSSLFQKDATASMVVFYAGMPERSEYKRFRIKSKKSKSDFEMLEEVFMRRFKQNWQKPNLIVVDGGTPQILKVKRVLLKQKLSIPLIGIAKHPDRMVVNASAKLITLRLRFDNLGFNLVRSMRDEAHRFARKYHLLLRHKRLML